MLVVNNLMKQYGDVVAVEGISFEAGAASVLPQLVALILGSALLMALVVHRFRYD